MGMDVTFRNMGTPSRRRMRLSLVALAGASAVAATAVPAAATSAPKPGHWTVLGAKLSVPEAGTPAVWQDATHHTWVLWLRKTSNSTSTYEAVELAPTGALVKGPVDVFAGHNWGSLSNQPTLLADGR